MTDLRQTLAAMLLVSGTLAGTMNMVGCGDNQSPGEAISSWMGDMSPPKPSEAARDAFNLYDADKRRRAVVLLSNASWGGEAPYLKTYRLLVDDPDPTVRAAAASALGRHGTISDVPALTRLLAKDDSKIVRWESARALQRIHSNDAVGPLVKALGGDSEADVRMASANALGQYADRQVFDALVSALNDENYAVVVEAAGALHTLTGQDFGQDGGQWWDWAKEQKNLFTDQQVYYFPQYDGPTSAWNRVAFWSPDKKEIPPEQPRSNVDEPVTVTQTTITVPTPAPTPQPQPAPAPAVVEPPAAAAPPPAPAVVEPPVTPQPQPAAVVEQPAAPPQPAVEPQAPAAAEQPQAPAAAEQPAATEPAQTTSAPTSQQPAQAQPPATAAAPAPAPEQPKEPKEPANTEAPNLPPPQPVRPPYQHSLGAGG